MNLPSTVKSVQTVSEMCGDRIEIVFANGAVVWVSAENDGLHYFAPGSTDDNPTVSLLVDLGAGMCASYQAPNDVTPNDVTVMRGADCKKLDVNHY